VDRREQRLRGTLTAFGGASNTCLECTTAFWRRQMMARQQHAHLALLYYISGSRCILR
jgi:hypothetical protein